MSPARIKTIAPAESMIGIALILLVVVRKVIQHLSKRLSLSQLTLETESSTLHLQIQPHSSQQELLQQELPGSDNHANSNNDDGRIPAVNQRPKL
jgi:hypothetical protein